MPIRRVHKPKPGWSDDDNPAMESATPAEIDKQITEATKEVTDVVGMGGSLGRVRSGGVGIKTGAGMEAIVGGIRKTTIEPDGDLFAGADIDTPEGLSFVVFVNAQNWNGEDMEEGDALFGDNSPEKSNIKWDASEGQWQFRFGTTVMVYMDTDGTIRAGGGDVTIDEFGIWFANQEGALQFEDTSGVIDNMIIYSNLDDHLVIENIVGGKSVIINVDDASHNIKSIGFSSETADFYGWLKVDNSADKRLEIGADHYFPTRDASNPNGFWNEANQDMDFTFEGTSGDVLKIDAGDNAAYYKGAELSVPTAETNANNIFQCSNPGGTSAFAGTINGTPSGTSVVYTPVSGTEGAMVPASTSQLAKMRLYNTTRGNSALISGCNVGTNTITLTATVPANWANGDTITIASQTVSGGGFDWVDLELTSGPTDKPALFISHVMNSATVGHALRVHPLESFSSSKTSTNIALTASQNCNGFGLLKLTSNVFSLSWTGTPATVVIREAGYLG